MPIAICHELLLFTRIGTTSNQYHIKRKSKSIIDFIFLFTHRIPIVKRLVVIVIYNIYIYIYIRARAYYISIYVPMCLYYYYYC